MNPGSSAVPRLVPATLPEILPLRERYRREMNCQIIRDSFHERGLATTWLIERGGEVLGYGSVAGYGPLEGGPEPRDTVAEFYLLPEHRGMALPLFRELIKVSGATLIQAQTNDTLLTLMLYDCARDIVSDRILFHDAVTTSLSLSGATFRRVVDADRAKVFEHKAEPLGEWLVELDGVIAGTGGYLTHYNPPYADLYMEVAEAYWRRGVGSWLVQEVKRVCREAGLVPAARCNVANVASRRTLEKAGLLPCARMLWGKLG